MQHCVCMCVYIHACGEGRRRTSSKRKKSKFVRIYQKVGEAHSFVLALLTQTGGQLKKENCQPIKAIAKSIVSKYLKQIIRISKFPWCGINKVDLVFIYLISIRGHVQKFFFLRNSFIPSSPAKRCV